MVVLGSIVGAVFGFLVGLLITEVISSNPGTGTSGAGWLAAFGGYCASRRGSARRLLAYTAFRQTKRQALLL